MKKMFSNYYDCPKDYRKDYRLIVAEAIARILGTLIAIGIMIIIFVAFS